MSVPAERYEPAGDLALVTSFFNPAGFASKWRNYERFLVPIRAGGLPLYTIECAFADRPFELPAGEEHVQVRSRSIMFQKERLLNLVIERLPARFTKVAWVDADILFADPRWAVRTSRALDIHAVVQPFETAYRLPPEQERYSGEGVICRSFAACYVDDRAAHAKGDFWKHGDTGFAWAARRDLLAKHGLYDAMILGSADHVMAHAALGDWTSQCIRVTAGVNNPYAADIRAWGRRFHEDVKGALGFVPGDLLHLWHGSAANRRYVERTKQLVALGYDPKTDLRVGDSGAWEWASDKPELHAWVVDYFSQRREDEALPDDVVRSA
ncbi:MAG: hypothetical protein ACAI38_10195 [Myxococcota bacterium]|nr:hypothetical protein [Myxococcota bacterium]